MRARVYNSVIGRFTQEDIYRGDGLNLYAYCGNNPIIYYDPSGYKCSFNKERQSYSGIEWKENLDKTYGKNKVKWTNKIQEFDIRAYGEFNKILHKGDDLSGHELLQNAWLEANGKISGRGKGLSRANPAIALKEDPIHKYISGQQKSLQMNVENLKGVSWRKNVLDNVKLMKKAGVPRDKILELLKETKKFAKKNNF